MRNLCLLIGLILLPTALRGGDLRPLIKREAGKCAAAWQRSDYEGMVSFMPSRVIQQMGGRAALIKELKSQFAQARSLGAQSLEVIPGQPSAPRQIGRWFTAVVPLTAVVHSAHLDLIQETSVLALSSDQGRRWFFVLLYQMTPAELGDWFPELRGKIRIPAEPAPRMELVY